MPMVTLGLLKIHLETLQTLPLGTILRSNTTAAEDSSGDQMAIDFLANGFKCRSSNAAISNDSATYIYCAWAENPFGGENTPPVPAR